MSLAKLLYHRTRHRLQQLMRNDRRRLAHFSISAVIFFVSCAMLYWVNKNMPPSLRQELTALLFISMAACAFAWAMLMQVLHIASKTLK
ncbi:MAG: hypothetical protein HKO71_01995 [Pseudomonadales bacterium]|nr:hypothetical protein [Pseudomonadales bacterium]